MHFPTLAAILALATSTSATHGVATYFYQNGNAGSCGIWNSDDSFIVALSAHHNPKTLCGRQITIRNTGGGYGNHGVGNTITAHVADTCPGDECEAGHVDLSVGAFRALTGGGLDPPGRIEVEWWFS